MCARYGSAPDPVAAAKTAARAFGAQVGGRASGAGASGAARGVASNNGSIDASGESQALSVSAAMQLAKGALEGVTVRLVGEVSELSIKPGYKAAYFTVKDSSAALPCMMWNNRYRSAGVQLAVGQLVELTGRFTLYAAKGRMNFDVFSVALAGEGNLRAQVANLARKLQVEGLMNPERKLPVPEYPLTIGLVTSPRGDAVHDVLRTLRRRFPVARVLLAGVPVEGPRAAAGIVEGMRAVVHAGAEVVLVVRGGGSYEDLMPFNDEFLARMIVKCPVPVVTGIGHEPDTSIADMVADLRASTPTAAAEKVSPARESLDALFAARESSLNGCVGRVIERSAARLSRVATRPVLTDPNALFAAEAQGLDIAADRLSRALPGNLERDRSRLERAGERMAGVLSRAFEGEAAALSQSCSRLSAQSKVATRSYAQQIALAAGKLDALSPLAVLGRGYAIARNGRGEVVKSIGQTRPGGKLDVSVSDGIVHCEVAGASPVVSEVVSMKGKQ